MSTKYKIDDAKKNKNLINDEIKLSRIKSNGNHGNGKTKPPKSIMPSWFKEFSTNINKRLDKQEEFNTRIENKFQI